VDAVLSKTTLVNSRVRHACGFMLGVLGAKSIDGLLRLTEDPSADVRLNAAIGLASLR
tara:strand:+ start:129 stop:302 length:174 start_codon:yes stop_codon:yes gene_type:complete